MNESERREAAENQAWEELPEVGKVIDDWLDQIESLCNLGRAVRSLGQISNLPYTAQRLWKPYIDSLYKIDSDWIATRTEEILQEGASEQLADRLAQGEDDRA